MAKDDTEPGAEINEDFQPPSPEEQAAFAAARWLGQNPTPEERGDIVVMRLEQLIRDGRTHRGGISFRKWQELARHEVANAIRDAERYWRGDEKFITRGLWVGAAALITVGTWGTVLATQLAPDRQTAALILLISGAVVLAVLGAWGIKRLDKYHQFTRRRDHFARVEEFDRQLARLDLDLEKRLKELEETLTEVTSGPFDKL